MILAGGADFSPDTMEFVMEPDGIVQEDYPISFSIVADNVHEALQVFAVEIAVLGNSEGIEMSRQYALCYIVNDDGENIIAIAAIS